MIDEVTPGDRVAHRATGRAGTVLRLRSRRRWWWPSTRIPEALIAFDAPPGRPWWVIRTALRRVDR